MMMLYAMQRHVLCFFCLEIHKALFCICPSPLHIDVISTVMTTIYSIPDFPYLGPIDPRLATSDRAN